MTNDKETSVQNKLWEQALRKRMRIIQLYQSLGYFRNPKTTGA